MTKRMVWLPVVTVAAVVLLAVGVAAFAGAYNVAADDPHWSTTNNLLQWARDRSIAARVGTQVVPNLADQDLIALGAEHYAAMCSGCHLAPGLSGSELQAGLYPQPPDLSRKQRPPSEQFWIIKHGIKMTGMPAWGTTHDDEAIWGLVAFVRQIPRLDATEYAALVGTSETSSHTHGERSSADADHGAAGTAKSDYAADGHDQEHHPDTSSPPATPQMVPKAKTLSHTHTDDPTRPHKH